MSEQDPSLDPGQEQRVRALLAGLGSGTGDGADQLPAEVAARLEDTLAGLVAEREAGKISEEHTATGNVVPLRPRWMPRLAAAAAAVIVLGLGALTATNLGRHHDATSADAGAGAAKAEQVPSASSPGTVDSSGTAEWGRRPARRHLHPGRASPAGPRPGAACPCACQRPAVSAVADVGLGLCRAEHHRRLEHHRGPARRRTGGARRTSRWEGQATHRGVELRRGPPIGQHDHRSVRLGG